MLQSENELKGHEGYIHFIIISHACLMFNRWAVSVRIAILFQCEDNV